MSDWMSPKQVATELGVCYDTLNRWIKKGVVLCRQPFGHRGRREISRAEVERLRQGGRE